MLETDNVQLKKKIKLRQLFTLSFGTIIGVGWIVVLGEWLTLGGPLGAIMAFIGGAAFMILIGICYAEIASMFPVTGGEVAYTYEMYGLKTSYITGWFLSLGYLVVTTFEAISAAWILVVIFPELEGPVLYTILGEDVHSGSLLIGLALMLVISFINYRGVKSATSFQDMMTFGLIVISIGFVITGLMRGDSGNLAPYFSGADSIGIINGILAVFATTLFWFSGFDTIPQAMGESSENADLHLLGRVIVLTIIASLVFYIVIILTCSMLIPRNELLALDLPAASAFEAAFQSSTIRNIVLFAGFLGLITTWNAMFYAGSRVIFALGRSYVIPPVFGKVHPEYRTPSNAIWFVCVLGSAGIFLGKGAIAPIVNATSASLAFVFCLVCIGLLRLRRIMPDKPRPFKVPYGAIIPVSAVVASCFMLFLALYQPLMVDDKSMPIEWMIIIFWSVIGMAFWMLTSGFRTSIDEDIRRNRIITGQSAPSHAVLPIIESE